jgi:hypothetical protein
VPFVFLLTFAARGLAPDRHSDPAPYASLPRSADSAHRAAVKLPGGLNVSLIFGVAPQRGVRRCIADFRHPGKKSMGHAQRALDADAYVDVSRRNNYSDRCGVSGPRRFEVMFSRSI